MRGLTGVFLLLCALNASALTLSMPPPQVDLTYMEQVNAIFLTQFEEET